MRKPNFFIVGAPKCGTTAMNDYLAQHPAVFMAMKELHYFGQDLMIKCRLTEGDYLWHFEQATDQKVVGEASVWYLFSKTAATEIKAFASHAKILIMLRNPVDVMHSLHSQHLYDGNEEETDFETAVGLDAERKAGRNQPNAVDFVELPPYLDSVLFYEQAKRYIDVFGQTQVHVVLYEDFTTNPKKAVAETLQFLGVEPKLDINYNVINANKRLRSFWLHRLIKQPPPSLKKLVRLILPSKKIRHRIMFYLSKKNVHINKRTPLPVGLRENLKQNLADDVQLLSKLIDRDLSHWLK